MFFNSLSAELNPICKPQLAGLFCRVLKFCTCFLKNLNISRTKRDKFVKQKAFCGEGNGHCSECLKNAVISLLRNREAKFLIKMCKFPFSLSYVVVKVSAVCTKDRRKKVVFCLVICKTFWSTQSATSHLTHLNITLHHTPRWTHVTPPFHGIAARPVIIVMCV